MKKILKYFLIVFAILNVLVITSGNMYMYKALIYNFPGIDDYKIFDNNVIKAANPQPWKVSEQYNKIKLDKVFIDSLEFYKTTAFLVVKNDSVIYENYWEDYSDTSHSGSFSAAKSIVSVLAGIALKEGKIKNIDEPVANYIPEFKFGGKEKITIRHLLNMSAGLKWDEAYSSLTSLTTKSYYGKNLYSLVTNLEVEKEPGVYYNYQSCNTELLAIVIIKATGKTLSQYASEKLWTPINAEHEAYWSLDQVNGIEKAFCCFNSNARDFARIGKLYLNKGNWNGFQIVDSSFVDESIRPAKLLNGTIPNTIYGFQWWCINRNGHQIFFARGILGQYIFVVPDKNLIVVRLGHERGAPTPDGYVTDVFTYLDEMIKVF